ncbi:MAG: L-seryl-tRNA(Sec) selenium transferase [Deltaproteobacteria bacterium]|nr:L-seryl-tRNA(Sec) selenium transferase [Deltaproteobacteria bacterium]
MAENLRNLPAIGRWLSEPVFAEALARHGRSRVVAAMREVLAAERKRRTCGSSPVSIEELVHLVIRHLQTGTRARLRPVINATGIILHTNLGRAPLAESAIEAVTRTARGYSNLEYDIESGERGSRHDIVRDKLARLAGAADAMVVNNNAAAVLLVLNTLAQSREVIVSRGELVEIGGSFRIPAVMEKSGCRLVEVGTTNKTHAADYRAAVTDATALFLKVHRGNFRMEGFVSEVGVGELARIGDEMGIPVVEDLGSGCLVNPDGGGLGDEPTVAASLKAGCAAVTFSGDKLLGGPQAGVIAGHAEVVEACRNNPLARALRVDKMTLAALEATLACYEHPETLHDKVPVLRMASTPVDSLRRRARSMTSRLRRALGDAAAARVVETRSRMGGGSLPGGDLPGVAVRIDAASMSANELERALRLGDPPVVGRIADGAVLIEMRTLLDGEDALVEKSLCNILGPGAK